MSQRGLACVCVAGRANECQGANLQTPRSVFEDKKLGERITEKLGCRFSQRVTKHEGGSQTEPPSPHCWAIRSPCHPCRRRHPAGQQEPSLACQRSLPQWSGTD